MHSEHEHRDSGEAAGGFTLIELLVVVAIIVALLAILLPSMNRAMIAAERTICATNQKQMHTGFLSYAADFYGQMPVVNDAGGAGLGGYFWRPAIAEYLLKNYFGNRFEVFYCPTYLYTSSDYAANYQPTAYWWWQTWFTTYGSSTWRVIGYEVTTHRGYADQSLMVATVSGGGSKVMFTDLHVTYAAAAGAWSWANAHAKTNTANPDGRNACLVDGSVNWAGFDEMRWRWNLWNAYYWWW